MGSQAAADQGVPARTPASADECGRTTPPEVRGWESADCAGTRDPQGSSCPAQDAQSPTAGDEEPPPEASDLLRWPAAAAPARSVAEAQGGRRNVRTSDSSG